MPSGCCGSHLQDAGANLAFYSEILGTAGLQEELGKRQEEYLTRLHALLEEPGGMMIFPVGRAKH